MSKFDGHIFSFDFKDQTTASLKNFYQEKEISDDMLNCEFEGVLEQQRQSRCYSSK